MPSETPRRPALRLGGCLFLIAFLVGAGVLTLSWLLETPAPGVDLAPDLDAYAWEELEAADRLEGDEEVIAFYDLTRSLNGRHAVVVTDQRLLLYLEEREQFVRWGSDSTVERNSSEGGERFEVSGSGGVIVFDVATGHGADRLAQAMEGALTAAQRRNRIAEPELYIPGLDDPSLDVPPPEAPLTEESPAPEVPGA